ncbi:hypothetical protein [Candidatus Pelagisphaera phototrophica]|uniref:hypothetical protein n=1 Tax=Candidatus Pelagisphaera phototrophica TaxID=2684113 RepID=UPI0019FEB078|nr:hypothetical protein [Candidatus Pelagisphaera phototrophica]QXD32949.1 hypothetical protein GA004_04340 [Candidatus Pelagisphaera phototrophica]
MSRGSSDAGQGFVSCRRLCGGLTGGLRKDELADLVAYLSELGKEGPYKVSSGRIARTFKYLHDQDGDSGFVDIVRHKPFGYVTSDDPLFEWRPLYARVDGTLPLDGIPPLRQHGRINFHYLRFQMDVRTAGAVGLKLSGPDESVLWAGDQIVEREKGRLLVSCGKGIGDDHLSRKGRLAEKVRAQYRNSGYRRFYGPITNSERQVGKCKLTSCYK